MYVCVDMCVICSVGIRIGVVLSCVYIRVVLCGVCIRV